jgi:hypothetical protein
LLHPQLQEAVIFAREARRDFCQRIGLWWIENDKERERRARDEQAEDKTKRE